MTGRRCSQLSASTSFPSLAALEERILGFQKHWQAVAGPFEWNFTRGDLAKPMARLADREPHLRLAA